MARPFDCRQHDQFDSRYSAWSSLPTRNLLSPLKYASFSTVQSRQNTSRKNNNPRINPIDQTRHRFPNRPSAFVNNNISRTRQINSYTVAASQYITQENESSRTAESSRIAFGFGQLSHLSEISDKTMQPTGLQFVTRTPIKTCRTKKNGNTGLLQFQSKAVENFLRKSGLSDSMKSDAQTDIDSLHHTGHLLVKGNFVAAAQSPNCITPILCQEKEKMATPRRVSFAQSHSDEPHHIQHISLAQPLKPLKNERTLPDESYGKGTAPVIKVPIIPT